MSWGMPYERFWHGSINEFLSYNRKYLLEIERQNEAAWLQGRYILEAVESAISVAFGGKHHYPKEPYGRMRVLTEEQQEKKQYATDLILEHNLLLRAKAGGKNGGADD